MITLAIRRLALDGGGRNELADLDLSGYTLLPNTAGATTADQAVRLARLARAASLSDLIKVEVIGDERTLLPDPARHPRGDPAARRRRASPCSPTAATTSFSRSASRRPVRRR